MCSVHTSHGLLWYFSLYSDGVARVFTASQERKASPDQIAVSCVATAVCMLVKKQVVVKFYWRHFHYHYPIS